MKQIFFFFIFLFLFFIAGFFVDAVFHFRGMLVNLALVWFFIFASYWIRHDEIVYAAGAVGLANSFFAVGPVWFWLLVFVAGAFVMMAAHWLASVSGNFQFFFFSLTGWAGMMLLRAVAVFVAGIGYPAYGTLWQYVSSAFFGREVALSVLFLLGIGVYGYAMHRFQHVYYV